MVYFRQGVRQLYSGIARLLLWRFATGQPPAFLLIPALYPLSYYYHILRCSSTAFFMRQNLSQFRGAKRWQRSRRNPPGAGFLGGQDIMLLSLLRDIADYERYRLHAGEPAGLIPWVLKSIDFLSLSQGIFQLSDPYCHVVRPISVS